MLEISILGPLLVCWDGEPVELAGAASRRLLVALVLGAGEWVPQDRLIDAVWGERPPASARKALQMHVSRLRAALAPVLADPRAVIVSGPAGYRLLGAGLDAHRFSEQVQEAELALRSGRAQEGADLLRRALSLWRGPALPELSAEHFTRAEAARLDEQRLAALELRIDADLASGRHAAVVGELRELVSSHPWRERLHGQLMLALYRCDRQAEALEAYRHARTVLVDELGLEPGPALRELERAILAQDPSLPAAPLPVVRIPVPPTPMIGRDDELETLIRVLAAQRHATVTGAGGVGKTRLALEAAHRAAERFRDGAAFVELAAVERAEHVAAAIARRLGVAPQAGEAPQDALARHLDGRELLLVLDNFEHVLDAAADVADLLAAAPALTVLVTSREPLRLRSEHVVALAPLAPETAGADLFVAVAQARNPHLSLPGEERGAVIEICRLLDGLPLAIELAAGGLGLLSLPELAAQLHRGVPALGPAPRDTPARQRTMHAAVAWSYELLAPDERRTLTALSVFAGGATIDAAQTVTPAALHVLEALVRKNLVIARSGRLELLETVRAFAREHADDDELPRRHADYYLAFAQRLRPALRRRGSDAPFADVDRELDNLRAALRWALARPMTAVALELVAALGPYWLVRGATDEGAAWAAAALKLPGERVPPRLRADALGAYAASLKEKPGMIDHAEAAATEQLELLRATGDTVGAARAVGQLAAISMHANRPAEAYARAREALVLAHESGDEVEARRSLATLAKTAPSMPEALAAAEQAATALRAAGNHWELVALATSMVYTALYHDDPALAEQLGANAIDAARAFGDARLIVAALLNNGHAALLSGHPDDAAGPLAEALHLIDEHGAWRELPLALEGLAGVAAARGLDTLAATLQGAAGEGLQHEPTIAARLQARYFTPAQSRLGEAAWERARAAGAALDREHVLGAARRVTPLVV